MKRREFFALPAALISASGMSAYARDLAAEAESSPTGSITDVAGLRVGHSTRTERPTGCTVLIADNGAVGAVDQRGGAPGTRETDLLNPLNLVEKINAISLSGGSAYGLATADGIVKYLEEKGMGYDIGGKRVVPIVPGAILMDLNYGKDWKIRPTADNGYKACLAASSRAPEQGSIGAGAGATVGKIFGMSRAMKGGFGTASVHLPNGVVVAAMVATNSLGDVWDHINGKLVAGARTEDGRSLADTMKLMREGKLAMEQPIARGGNTTIGVIATNADLSKTQLAKVTEMSSSGFGLAVRPVYTPFDGDTVFGVATGTLKTPSGRENANRDMLVAIIGALAADTLARAVLSAVLHAKSSAEVPGVPGASEMPGAPRPTK